MGEESERPDLYDVLDAWDLLSPDVRLQRYSLRDWKKISRAVAKASPGSPVPALGSVHLGVARGVAIAEGRLPVAVLATHAVTASAVWLPNPIASFLCDEPSDAWARLPESGNRTLGSTPVSHWKPFWQVPIDRRRAAIMEALPSMLTQLRELRGLAASGAVRFITWECPIVEDAAEFGRHVVALRSDPEFCSLAQRLPQDAYTLGPRLGALGLTASDDFSDGSVRKGEGLHWSDKTGIALSTILNAAISARAAASFAGDLAGDRLAYDYVLTSGASGAHPLPLAPNIALPNFGDALLPDVVAVRKDSELLAALRTIIVKAAGATETQALPSLRAELDELAHRLAEDASLRKAFGVPTTDMALGVLGTALGAYAVTGSPLPVAAGAVAGLVAYLAKMLRPLVSSERDAAKTRAEVIRSITRRLGLPI